MLYKIYLRLFTRDIKHYWKRRGKAAHAKSRLVRLCNLLSVNRYHAKYNAHIHVAAKIANMPTFPHELNGIFISAGAQIGENCVIFHQVTIGSNTLSDSNRGAPIIGDNVYIGAGAKIIGNVRIGDNVRIGANCVVAKDVPADSTVVLQAAKIIAHTESKDNAFYSFS